MISIAADRSFAGHYVQAAGVQASQVQSLAGPSVITGDVRQQQAAVVHLIVSEDEPGAALAAMLRSAGFGTLIYSDLGAFVAAGRTQGAACLVLDARLSLIGEIGAEPQLRTIAADIPTIIIASDASVSLAVRAMKAGAVDFLQKPIREQDMLAAIEAAVRTDRERRLAEERRGELGARYGTLTRREREVMALVATGKMNKQVAGVLGLSEITVKVHRGSVMRKMQARTLADLVRMADALDDPAATNPFRAVASPFRTHN